MQISRLILPIALAFVVACQGTVADTTAPDKNEDTASETATGSDDNAGSTLDETGGSDATEDTQDGTAPTETEVDPTDDTTDGTEDTEEPTDETTDPIEDGGEDVTEDPCEEEGPTCKGSVWPEWDLEDFQPNSPRFGESYGLNTFEGTVTVMSLHAAWCSYCRGQAMLMDQMLKELRAEGYDVEFVTVNKINAAEEGYQLSMIYVLNDQNEIQYGEDGQPIYRCTFPLLQDVEELNVWEIHEGRKDDFYIYDVDGTLAHYLPSGTDFSTRLSTDIGYGNLKAMVVSVLTGEEPVLPEPEPAEPIDLPELP